MMYHRRIGSADIFNIVEYVGPTHDPARVFPDLEGNWKSVASQWPYQYVPTLNRFVIAIQIWVVRWKGNVIVIDTGCGNFKSRPAALRMDNLNNRVLEWLEAAGAGRDQVTHVINTHLHGDHVGWNTMVEDGANVPTFRKAQYFMPQADYDYFRAIYDGGDTSVGAGAFGDSVLPVVDAGHVTMVEGDGEIAGLTMIPAPGHTPGMYRLTLSSDGETGIFCADIFHSPIQIHQPTLNTMFCMLPEGARETRQRFLEDVAGSGALVMPCHFAFPHAARIGRSGGRFTFHPVPVLPVA